jgi:hypothetical protein
VRACRRRTRTHVGHFPHDTGYHEVHDRNADPAPAALRPGPAGRAAARAGIAKLKAHARFGFLFPYFQRARLEDANAFDINVAMVYPTTDPRSDAFEQHYDVVFTKYLLDEAPVAGLTVRAPAQSTCGAALVLGSQRRAPAACPGHRTRQGSFF